MNKEGLFIKKANPLVKKIFRLALKFPQKYQFSVGEQLRRSSLSIALNIVEAGARRSDKEKKQLLSIAFGSLKETKYLVYFIYDFNLIGKNCYNEIREEIEELAKILYGFLYKNK